MSQVCDDSQFTASGQTLHTGQLWRSESYALLYCPFSLMNRTQKHIWLALFESSVLKLILTLICLNAIRLKGLPSTGELLKCLFRTTSTFCSTRTWTRCFRNTKLSALASNLHLFCWSGLTYRQPCMPENNKTVFTFCTAVIG